MGRAPPLMRGQSIYTSSAHSVKLWCEKAANAVHSRAFQTGERDIVTAASAAKHAYPLFTNPISFESTHEDSNHLFRTFFAKCTP